MNNNMINEFSTEIPTPINKHNKKRNIYKRYFNKQRERIEWSKSLRGGKSLRLTDKKN